MISKNLFFAQPDQSMYTDVRDVKQPYYGGPQLKRPTLVSKKWLKIWVFMYTIGPINYGPPVIIKPTSTTAPLQE